MFTSHAEHFAQERRFCVQNFSNEKSGFFFPFFFRGFLWLQMFTFKTRTKLDLETIGVTSHICYVEEFPLSVFLSVNMD